MKAEAKAEVEIGLVLRSTLTLAFCIRDQDGRE
jgi:hypothetical protein